MHRNAQEYVTDLWRPFGGNYSSLFQAALIPMMYNFIL